VSAAAGRLSGKVALVTGAASGQGAAHARRFVAEGARVMLTDVLVEAGRELAAELGDAAAFAELDVRDGGAWTRVVGNTAQRFGPPTVLVNNAGIARHCSILEEDQLEWQRVIDVNLTGCWHGMRAVAPGMQGAGGGSIVNISSNAAMVGFANLAAYTASKWALRGLTKCAALEFGAARIRVNSVHPGAVDTPMLNFDAGESSRFAAQPIPRAARPEEIADAVLFLASDESSFITGAELVIDGGMIIGPTPPAQR
jgi:3alpha(or 20beta)-hydroxysteroid dehydrogenase